MVDMGENSGSQPSQSFHSEFSAKIINKWDQPTPTRVKLWTLVWAPDRKNVSFQNMVLLANTENYLGWVWKEQELWRMNFWSRDRPLSLHVQPWKLVLPAQGNGYDSKKELSFSHALPVCLSVCLSISLSVCPPACLYVCLPVCLSGCLSAETRTVSCFLLRNSSHWFLLSGTFCLVLIACQHRVSSKQIKIFQ